MCVGFWLFMKLRIPQHITFRISYLFLLILLVVFFIPIKHKVHCLPVLALEECPFETAFAGILFAGHLFKLVVQVFTLEFDAFSPEILRVIFFSIFVIIGLNFLTNFFLQIRFEGRISSFLRRENSFKLDLIPNKTAFLSLTLLLVSIFIGLIISELFVSYFHPQELKIFADRKGELTKEHAVLGWINTHNISTTLLWENGYFIQINQNNLGFRSEEDIREKTKKRILLLGDSFIHGDGLDSNETLDYFLHKELGANYDIINAGVSGYSTLQEYLLLKEIYGQVKPDLLITEIFVNDFKDNIFPKLTGKQKPIFSGGSNLDINKKMQKGGNIITEMRLNANYLLLINPFFYDIKKFLREKSNLFNFLYNNHFSFLGVREESFRGEVFMFSNKNNVIITLANFAMCEILKTFKYSSEEVNLPYLFIYIPHRIEIESWRAVPTINRYYDLSVDQLDLNTPEKELRSCTQQNSINFFSLKNKFSEVKEGLYNLHGDHWSPKATNITAQLLKEELVKRGFINSSEIKSS